MSHWNYGAYPQQGYVQQPMHSQMPVGGYMPPQQAYAPQLQQPYAPQLQQPYAPQLQQPMYQQPQQQYQAPVQQVPQTGTYADPYVNLYPNNLQSLIGVTPATLSSSVNQTYALQYHKIINLEPYHGIYRQIGNPTTDLIAQFHRMVFLSLFARPEQLTYPDNNTLVRILIEVVVGDILMRCGGTNTPIAYTLRAVPMDEGTLNGIYTRYAQALGTSDSLYTVMLQRANAGEFNGMVQQQSTPTPTGNIYQGTGQMNHANIYPSMTQQPQTPRESVYGTPQRKRVKSVDQLRDEVEAFREAEALKALQQSQRQEQQVNEPIHQFAPQHNHHQGISSLPTQEVRVEDVISLGEYRSEIQIGNSLRDHQMETKCTTAANPEQFPTRGMPNAGTVKFSTGQEVTMEDYNRQVTEAEYHQNKPSSYLDISRGAASSFDDEDDDFPDTVGYHDEMAADAAMQRSIHEAEAEIQTSHERALHIPTDDRVQRPDGAMVQPKRHPQQSMAGFLAGSATGYIPPEPVRQPEPVVEQSDALFEDITELFQPKDPADYIEEDDGVAKPDIRVPLLSRSRQERIDMYRTYKLRVAPAYLKGQQVVRCMVREGKRELVLENIEVDYKVHETEGLRRSNVFSADDYAARQADALKVMNNSAEANAWSPETLKKTLDEKLNSDEANTRDPLDVLLEDLIGVTNTVNVDATLFTEPGTTNYMSKISEELHEREVEDVGALLDNAVITYSQIETSNIVCSENNCAHLNALTNAETLDMIRNALIHFKGDIGFPSREIARHLANIKKHVNYLLATEFNNGWSISDPIEDIYELVRLLSKSYHNVDEHEDIVEKVTNIYKSAIDNAIVIIENENSVVVGEQYTVSMLPFHYDDYPLTFVDGAGAIERKNHPELYDLLNSVSDGKETNCYRLVTLDNVALTFCRSLSDGLFFMVDLK